MQWHPFPLQPLGHTHLVPTALYKKCPIDSFYSCKTLCYLSFATKSPHKTIKFKGDGFMPAYIVKILVALSFTVIRKYLQQIITNADKQDCKQRVYHFQKWSALCFSISALLRSRTPFLREKV